MPTKTNYKSPLKYKDPFEFLNNPEGYAMGPSKNYAGGAGFDASKFAKGATAGVGAFGGAAGEIVGSFRGDDPTKSGYAANTVASQALKYAGMGAALGPIGAGAGALIGAGLGAISAKKDKEEFEEQQEEMVRSEGMSTAQQQFMKNQAMYGAVDTPIAMLGKQLKSIPYTEPKNMSALQYKSGLKMKEISGVNTLPS